MPAPKTPFVPGSIALQLTDGTMLVQEWQTSNWYKLTPDEFADYDKGTWSKAASLPKGHAPQFAGSAVLPDGRVIVEGGEFNGTSPHRSRLTRAPSTARSTTPGRR